MAQKLKYSANFKRNYVAFFAFVIFCIMIIFELILALSVPAFVQRENAYADEIKKRQMLLLFDVAQKTCRAIPEKDETIKLEKLLLTDTMDILAVYLRKESDRLTTDDVDKLDPLIKELHKIAAKLEKGIPYSSENKLDSAKYLDNLIKQRK